MASKHCGGRLWEKNQWHKAETVFSIKFTIIQTAHPMSRYHTRETIVFLATILFKKNKAAPRVLEICLFFTCFGIRSGLFLECRKIAVITFLMSSDMIQCTRSQVAAKIMINSAISPHRAFTFNPFFAS